MGGQTQAGVSALSLAGHALYVGGHFTSAGTTDAHSVARLDTTSQRWSTLGSGISGGQYTYVVSLAPDDDGIYIGGNFARAGTQSSLGMARWAAPVASGSIGAAGGRLDGPDGTSLTFPAGAIPDGSTVNYTALFTPAHLAADGQAILRSFRIEASDASGNPITSFAQPYTLRVPYTDAQLAALGISDPSRLNVTYWDGTAWQALLPCAGCSVDSTNKVVIVVANHFSDFALEGAVQPDHRYVYLPLIHR